MPEPSDPVVAPEKKHEAEAVSARPILWAAGLLLATVVIVLIALVGFQDYLRGREGDRAVAGANPLGGRRGYEPPNEQLADIPPPRLEGLVRLRDDATAGRTALPSVIGNAPEFHPENMRPERWPQLQTFGWVDKDKGIAHIPIDLAMSAALKMNLLPTQPERKGK